MKLGKAKKGVMAIFFLGFLLSSFGVNCYIDFYYGSHMPNSPQIETGRIYPFNVNSMRGEYSARYVNKKELERAEFAQQWGVFAGLIFFAGIGALKVYCK